MYRHLLLTATALLFLWQTALYAQSISIINQTSYHKATYGATYGSMETGTVDNGGLITLFVRNSGSVPDSIQEIKVSKGGAYDTLHYAMWWPLEMQPGGTSSVWLKGVNSPFSEGDTLLIEVTTSGGHYAQQTFVNRTPGLRIANIMPEHDMSALWVYLRNDETTDAVLTGIDFNDVNLQPGNPGIEFVGNSPTVSPGGVAIIKLLASSVPLSALMSVRLNVRYQTGNNSRNVSSFQRLVPAEFPIGTWHSPTANESEEESRKRLRRLSITSVFGPNDASDMSANLPEYYMRVVREPDFSNNGTFDPVHGGQYVAQQSANASFHYWLVEDEPDLSNKPIREELKKNMAYWMNDTNTPSYVNLASQKNFQRYGFFTDVVSMDHYSDDGPPNVIPFPHWYTVEGSVREAIEYTEQLKKNTEPKRMSSWSQLISNAFSNQAEPFVLNFQFWAHVSAGAKGIYFFTAKPNHLTDEPARWAESEKLVHQLNGIKNLCLYTEPWDGVTVNTGSVIAKALVGRDALTLVVLNNTIDYTSVNIINRVWTAAISAAPFDIQFAVPDWIPLDQFYETDEWGKSGITSITNLGGRTFRITGTVQERTKVFVIGKNDTEAPQQITEINVSDKKTPSDFTLSWNEPKDNFGVKGYYIKADNLIIDSVQAPIWESNNKANGCVTGYWSVIPYDDAHNTGQPGVLTIDWSSIGSGTPMVTQQPVNQSVNAGAIATFIIADSGATATSYVWQVDTGNGVWTDLQSGSAYSGINTASLSVYGLPDFDSYRYRCVVSAGCSIDRDTSAEAELTVTGSLSVADITDALITVFPNPSRGQFTVRNESNEPFLVRITDPLGRLVQQPEMSGARSDVMVRGLFPGAYQVTLQRSKGSLITKRVVVF